ncbi:MAG: alanine--glyoxylate aminotransferase family protein [Candidatus Latescibacterota bacterium]
MSVYRTLHTAERILLGPGPSNVHPRVLQALASPLVGHLDPQFLAIMEDVKSLLQEVFQTRNRFTIPISGTGSAGMEACLANVVEPGDRVLVCVNGVFGRRMLDVAQRCGAEAATVEAPWGHPIAPEAVRAALSRAQYKVVGIVHAETSTGVLQPLEEIATLARDNGALLLVDAVTSLGGVRVVVDEWGVDLCYSGTQKCLSCPPGLAPVSFSQRAVEAVHNRRRPPQSWYLDLGMLERYWGEERVYHHTAPVSMNYALREALLLIHEEGLEARWERHRRVHQALVRGLEALGLEMPVEPAWRLPTLSAVLIPGGVDDRRARAFLLQAHGLEIGAGLGEFAGKAWRIGLMGHSATLHNVVLLLTGLGAALADQGVAAPVGEAVQAALGQ